mmetsp:Transcript_36709/g.59313  ORF Transcript_36709/g.59313 Transcript_36709/m.59313 type:complete len:520 (-) Transcript_36709:770-2329(-)|eukprot:CAMPEP_0184654090 /NCGR_PEP_ID=MMETSP0308-20130426/11786_1 /TAXON_ID=38269 /ORGANISM="Gloeochaete witrockiana, Strain SAG 46.84" /LENGTH=519 /DNA_ID=CAMNT_0027089903 /DNA_START=53 /DNA_END=1612 /DNA_ORIENTATION=-
MIEKKRKGYPETSTEFAVMSSSKPKVASPIEEVEHGSVESENEEDEDEDIDNDSEDGGHFDFSEEIETAPARTKSSRACLTEDEIFEAQQTEISKVSEILSVSSSAAGALLRHFRWNQEALIAKYLEDPGRVLQEAGVSLEGDHFSGESAQHPSSSGSQPQSTTCAICFEDNATLWNPCGHGFCSSCWGQYLTMKIDEGEAKNIVCPAFKCKTKVSDGTIEKMVDKAVFAKYKSFLARSFVDDNPNVRWCPAPNCGRAVTGALVDKSNVKCSCGHKFCFKCKFEAHRPASCDMVKLWLQKCKDDSETYNWLSANTQDCPQCRSAIEKNGGCNHMTCKQCKGEFCWVCQGEWKSHNDYYSCNRYDKNKTDPKETDKKKSKAALERYLHYYHRYVNHDKSLKLEGQLREKAEAKMSQLQNSTDETTWIDVQYIQRAADQLVECRQVLKFTYVFAFYLEAGPEKDLFEYLQEDLEATTERLSGMLEQEAEMLSKSDVMNTTRLAHVRLQHLLEGVEKGLITQ